MATVKVSSQIAAPVERVFQMFTDIEHGAEHVSGIKKIETLTTGPFSLGTRWQQTRDVLGRLDDALTPSPTARPGPASTRSSRSNRSTEKPA